MSKDSLVALAVGLAVGGVIAFHLWNLYRELWREQFIREYEWPPQLLDKLIKHHASFTRKETALVGNALRQFFLAYLKSGRKYVSMPSQVVDDLWHEFILYTRDYKLFCDKAFGNFLHHTPAVRLFG